jgi:predicted amidohydrolase YtcJ
LYLSDDIFEIEEDKIKDVAVIQTVFDGETIFEA